MTHTHTYTHYTLVYPLLTGIDGIPSTDCATVSSSDLDIAVRSEANYYSIDDARMGNTTLGNTSHSHCLCIYLPKETERCEHHSLGPSDFPKHPSLGCNAFHATHIEGHMTPYKIAYCIVYAGIRARVVVHAHNDEHCPV